MPNFSWLNDLFKLFGKLTPQQRKKIFFRLLMSIIVALIVSLSVLYISITSFGFRIEGGKAYLGVYKSNLPGIVIVDSTAGWQDSGIELEKNDTVHIEANGRIHLSIEHIIHLAELAKPLIIEKMSDQELQQLPVLSPSKLRSDYPPRTLNDSNRFFRQWTGPEGEPSTTTPSDLLSRCRINQAENWGKLFFTVLPRDVKISGRRDPFAVINEAKKKVPNFTLTTLDDLKDSNGNFKSTQTGKLVLIINDAVTSQLSPPEFPECRKYYEALLSKVINQRDNQHQLDLESIPLIWFADNVGSFHVVVSRV